MDFDFESTIRYQSPMYAKKEDQRKCWREWYHRNKKRVRQEVQSRRKVRQKWFIAFKSKLRCKKCGERHQAALQFHHLDRTLKEYAVSTIVRRGWSKERVLNEVAKCIVLCANCHLKLHYRERKKK